MGPPVPPESPALVWDLGSWSIRAGFGGEPAPRVDEPSVVACFPCGPGWEAPRGVAPAPSSPSARARLPAVGREAVETLAARAGALAPAGASTLELRPVEGGRVCDWEAALWALVQISHERLGVSPGRRAVVLAAAPDSTPADLEAAAEAVFEGLSAPGLLLVSSAVLTLYAQRAAEEDEAAERETAEREAAGREGRGGAAGGGKRRPPAPSPAPPPPLTGIVVDCGEARTTVVPVVEGAVLSHGVRCSPRAGGKCTDLAREALRREGAVGWAREGRGPGRGISRREAADAKEAACSLHAKEAAPPTGEGRLEIPSGDACRRGDAGRGDVGGATASDALGALFDEDETACGSPTMRPSAVPLGPPLHRLVLESARACPLDVRRDLLAGIVVTGGCARLPGFSGRLRAELQGLLDERRSASSTAPRRVLAAVVDAPGRGAASWLGASRLAASDEFPSLLVSKEEYTAAGPALVRERSVGFF